MATATETPKSSGSGHALGKGGARLSAAFEAVNTLPALAETIDRLAKLTSKEGASVGDIAEAIESDTAVAIAVMRAANNGGGPRGRVGSVPDAVEALTPAGVRALTGRLETYEFFQPVGNWDRLPDRFRRHAVATRHAAERIAELGDVNGRDELATAVSDSIASAMSPTEAPSLEVSLARRSIVSARAGRVLTASKAADRRAPPLPRA